MSAAVLLFMFGAGLTTHYWLFYGARWAVLGALIYLLVVMTAIWLL